MTASGQQSAQATRLLKRAPTISLMAIGTFCADNGLRSLVVNPVGVVQNQHSSPSTKGSKPLRNEKDEREGLENPRHVLPRYKNRPRHKFTSWQHWGSPAFGRCPFLPSLFPNLHLRYLNMSGGNFFAGAHDFVARDNIFIETVSGILTKVSIKQADVGSVAAQHPQQLWQ